MKKLTLLCVVALCLAACHCERKTTGTPCRKAACQQCKNGKLQTQCKCHDVWMGPMQQACACTSTCKVNKPAPKPMPAPKPAPAPKPVETKAAEQTAALSTVGNATQTGNTIALKYREPIRFAYNSDVIQSPSYKELNETADILKQYPDNTITVKGYTDSLGNPDYNVDLSQRRAQAVANALIARGVKAENITAVGYGAANPVATNKTSAGRAQNRRVELEINVK